LLGDFCWKSDEIATLLAGAPTQARHKLSNSDKIKTLELGQEQKLSKRTENQKENKNQKIENPK